jgi:hypothetical protein
MARFSLSDHPSRQAGKAKHGARREVPTEHSEKAEWLVFFLCFLSEFFSECSVSEAFGCDGDCAATRVGSLNPASGVAGSHPPRHVGTDLCLEFGLHGPSTLFPEN